MKKTKTFLWVLFALAVFTQLGILINMIVGAETTLSHGKIVRFLCEPVDPYDAFRGRYIQLSLEAFNHNSPQETQHLFDETLSAIPSDKRAGKTVYALLDIDNSNYASVREYLAVAPKDPEAVWIQVRLMDSWNQIDHPLARYYVNEKIAESAQRALNASVFNRLSSEDSEGETPSESWVEVSIHKGRSVIRELYIEGLSLQQYLEVTESL